MSRFLKHNKRKIAMAVLAIFVLCVFAFLYVFFHLNFVLCLVLVIVIYLILFTGYMLNRMTVRKMVKMREPFNDYSSIRNVDCLIIGDQCNPKDFIPKDKTYVQISAPNRGIRSAYQILRHTHSILKGNAGTVIFVCGKSKKEFCIFDIPFLHPITIKKYHLDSLKRKSRFPILFAPITSLRFLFCDRFSQPVYTIIQNADPELVSFCEERNYTLQCFIKRRGELLKTNKRNKEPLGNRP